MKRSKQLFETEFVGEIGVGSGHVEIGDVGEVQMALPTRLGDGLYPVTEIKVNGEIRGYFICVDALEDWTVSEINGQDRPVRPAKKTVRKVTAKPAVRKVKAAA